MLINPAIQTYAVIDPSGDKFKLGEHSDVRSDIPPVKEVVTSEQAKDHSFSLRRSVDGVTPETLRDEPEESAGIPSNNKPLGQSSATEESEQARLQEKEDELVLRQLKARDREVRVHEAAHAAVGGRYAGSPSLTYTRGPDGANYATDGEVSISISKVAGDPQATIEKARVIRSAALAPASPSVQDRRVASIAAQLESDARIELRNIATEERAEAASEAAENELKAKEQRLMEAEAANEAAEEAEEAKDVAAVTSASISSQNESQSSDSESDEEAVDEAEAFDGKQTTAKDRLENILLSAKPISVELNELGLVDAENPFGKSGFISLIA